MLTVSPVVEVQLNCVWDCKLSNYVVISMVTTSPPPAHTLQRILDGLNEGKNQNIRLLEEQIQAEKAIETYLEARHEAFEIIQVHKLRKNFFFVPYFPLPFFPPLIFFHPSSLLFSLLLLFSSLHSLLT